MQQPEDWHSSWTSSSNALEMETRYGRSDDEPDAVPQYTSDGLVVDAGPQSAAEIARLRRENARLKMEHEILKNCDHHLEDSQMIFSLTKQHRDTPEQMERKTA